MNAINLIISSYLMLYIFLSHRNTCKKKNLHFHENAKSFSRIGWLPKNSYDELSMCILLHIAKAKCSKKFQTIDTFVRVFFPFFFLLDDTQNLVKYVNYLGYISMYYILSAYKFILILSELHLTNIFRLSISLDWRLPWVSFGLISTEKNRHCYLHSI